ncbi:GNAT family N-acetyltransferase/peptidase C39 family protein [Pontibacter sp. JAM-7]|uniref:GNAT family N-acetyltransferase/peptidase C39 family protein n=1 Tax=Pontibacter sp. JAM-7 TaxID=3366581 RepID=UPI003AF5C5FC
MQQPNNRKNASSARLREATRSDIDQLVKLEESAPGNKQLSKRRMKYWVDTCHRIFLIAERRDEIQGYILILLHKGTRLARLHSLAISSKHQKQGIAKQLLVEAEKKAAAHNRFFMRVEVARNNSAAISLYEKLGYKIFELREHHYQNHQDAVRMQKRIRNIAEPSLHRTIPWYQQSTDFTCGPAALMMAMAGLDNTVIMNQTSELAIWREATTIFMTSGHGGCHPIGLALAAHHRGFAANVYLNTQEPLFINGVRTPAKKEVIRNVDKQFRATAQQQGLAIYHQEITQDHIAQWIESGHSIIILISTYRMDGRKAPHWVTISGIDDNCLYVHDPDPETGKQDAFDCQYVPIAREDFALMSGFGAEKLRTCVVISNPR